MGIAALIGLLLCALVVGVLGRSWRTAVVTLAAVVTSLDGGALGAAPPRRNADLDDRARARRRRGPGRRRRGRRRRRPPAAAPAASGRRGRRPARLSLAEAVRARRGPLVVATLVTLLALGPLFLLSGPAGALVRPAVLTFALAVAASLVVALVVTPVLARPADRGAGPGEPDHRIARLGDAAVSTGWRRGRAARRPAAGALAVLALLALPALALVRPGDTLPSAQDRSVVVRPAGGARDGAGRDEPDHHRGCRRAERSRRGALGRHPRRACRRVGPGVRRRHERDLADRRRRRRLRGNPDGDPVDGAGLPGPAQRRHAPTPTDQLAAAGATTGDELVVRVYGQDLATLRSTAEDVRQEIQTVPGVIAPVVQAQVTEPTIEIQVDLPAAQRVGLRPGDVRRDASTLISGLTVGRLYEGQAIFDVVLWGGPPTRASVRSLQSLLHRHPVRGAGAAGRRRPGAARGQPRR